MCNCAPRGKPRRLAPTYVRTYVRTAALVSLSFVLERRKTFDLLFEVRLKT